MWAYDGEVQAEIMNPKFKCDPEPVQLFNGKNPPPIIPNCREVAVRPTTLVKKPFCNLVHFERNLPARRRKDPKVLVVAPMAGHFATLLRGTVRDLLPDHDVYVTEWQDARFVPRATGPFDLDVYIDYIIEFLRFFRGNVHVMAVCQPTVPVFAAVSLLEAS